MEGGKTWEGFKIITKEAPTLYYAVCPHPPFVLFPFMKQSLILKE
jgi:hypothetical protein